MINKKMMEFSLAALLTVALGFSVAPEFKKISKLVSSEVCNHINKQFHKGVAPTSEAEGYPDHWGCCSCGLAAEDEAFTKILYQETAVVGSRDNIARKNKLALGMSMEATAINKEDVRNEILKTVIEDKIKVMDQKSPTYMNIEGRQALYFSKAETSSDNTAAGYSEFRFPLNGQNVTSLTFEYKYYDLNHDVFNSEDRVMAKWKLGETYNVSELKLINDNEWHTATVFTHDGLSHSDYAHIQFDIFHFTGELYFANPMLNKVSMDLDVRNFSYGGVNNGNIMQVEYGHTAESSCFDINQLTVKPNPKYPTYDSVGFNFDEVALKENMNYLEVQLYLDSPNYNTVHNGLRFMNVKENEKGIPTGSPLTKITLNPNQWATLYVDINSIKDDSSLKRFGLCIWDNEEFKDSIIINKIRIVSELSAPTITGIEYSLEENKYIFDNIAGLDVDLLKDSNELKDSQNNEIKFNGTDAGVHNIYINLDNKLVYIEVIVVSAYIKTAEQFAEAIVVNDQDNNGYYVLANDLYGLMNTKATCSAHLNQHYFNGVIDGRGHYCTYNCGGTSDTELNGLIGTAKFGPNSLIKNITFYVTSIGAWCCGRLFGQQINNARFENVNFNKIYETYYAGDDRRGNLVSVGSSNISFVNCNFNTYKGEKESLFNSIDDKVTFTNCTFTGNEAANIATVNTVNKRAGLERFNYKTGTTLTLDVEEFNFEVHKYSATGWSTTTKVGSFVNYNDTNVPEGAVGKVGKMSPVTSQSFFLRLAREPILCTSFSMRIYLVPNEETTTSVNNMCRLIVDGSNAGSNKAYTLETGKWVDWKTTSLTENYIEGNNANFFKGMAFLVNNSLLKTIYIDSFTITY